MEIEHVIMLCQLASMAAGVVWAVVKIKSTTEMLGVEITHLSSTIEKLGIIVRALESDYGNLRERVAVIEHELKGNTTQWQK